MGIQKEVVHGIVLRGCRNVEHLQVGGWWIFGWFTALYRRWLLDALIREAGFTCFGSDIRRYSAAASHGYTYVMIIGQSAINIHTYPEEGAMTVWLITCPGEDDDGSATRELEGLLMTHFRGASSTSKPYGSVLLQEGAS